HGTAASDRPPAPAGRRARTGNHSASAGLPPGCPEAAGAGAAPAALRKDPRRRDRNQGARQRLRAPARPLASTGGREGSALLHRRGGRVGGARVSVLSVPRFRNPPRGQGSDGEARPDGRRERQGVPERRARTREAASPVRRSNARRPFVLVVSPSP